MFKVLALVACCVTVSVPVALASEGDTTPQSVPLASPVPPPPCSDRGELNRLLAPGNWHTARPMAGKPPACEGLAVYEAKLNRRFQRWRTYRLVTPYQGCSGGGRWLRYTAVPGYVVEHESHCSWGAVNSSSGACGPYQLNGWTSCATSSWADKMRHHRMAAYVLREQGLGPAWTSNW